MYIQLLLALNTNYPITTAPLQTTQGKLFQLLPQAPSQRSTVLLFKAPMRLCKSTRGFHGGQISCKPSLFIRGFCPAEITDILLMPHAAHIQAYICLCQLRPHLHCPGTFSFFTFDVNINFDGSISLQVIKVELKLNRRVLLVAGWSVCVCTLEVITD